MDEIDRSILFDLYNNCRMSYRELAEKHDLTVSAVWRRVQQLEEDGVIDHYSLEINPSKIPSCEMMVIFKVDGTVDEQTVVKHLFQVDFVCTISSITNREGTVFLEGPDLQRLEESMSQIEHSEGISSIEAYRLDNWSEAREWESEIDEGLPSFTRNQIEVLRVLYENPRASIAELRAVLDWSHRRVKKTLEEMINSDSVFFTMRVSLRRLTAIFKVKYNTSTSEEKIMHWFKSTYPNKYVYTFTDSSRKTAFVHVSVDSLDESEGIGSKVREVEGIENVETLFHRPYLKRPKYRAQVLKELISR